MLCCPTSHCLLQVVVPHQLLAGQLLAADRASVVAVQPAPYVCCLIAVACLHQHHWLDHELANDGTQEVTGGSGGTWWGQGLRA